MQLAMIGLGRMGGNMVQRLLQGGHDVVVYDRSAGVTETTHPVATRQPMPPLTTEAIGPAHCASSPASNSPSCGPPMKKAMLTPVIRPRRPSGVSSCRIRLRNTALTVSAAPVTARHPNVNQNEVERPNEIVARP